MLEQHTGLEPHTKSFPNLLVVGWREWVSLPELGVDRIKAKIDTGARTSTLHAYDIEVGKYRGRDIVKFKVHPLQRQSRRIIVCQADLYDERMVRSSSGHSSLRPVIMTRLLVGPCFWDIELTLTNRDKMGFRMLIGRQAIRKHLLVHPGKSFILGGRKRKQEG
ncbi:MAG: RimK/LysX family protein [Proteobacteria bacterium]|nr:RimK/LysX family protein [Pseudomonadota bacterium]